MLTGKVWFLMVGADIFLTGLLMVLGLAATGGGFLYRRDGTQQEDIDANEQSVRELDRGFVQLTTRLFGHPDDDSDRGEVPERAKAVERAEAEIDSLSDEVDAVRSQSEQNGRAIDDLDRRVTAHAERTSEALARIENCLPEEGDVDEEGGSDLLPDGGDEDGE